MSNRLFQGVVHQMKDAIDRTIGVMDENYTIIACSELLRIGESQEFETFPIMAMILSPMRARNSSGFQPAKFQFIGRRLLSVSA